MIHTSYFANIKNLPTSMKKISISRVSPDWANIDEELKELAPSSNLLRRYKDGLVSKEMYEVEYIEQLRNLDPFEIGNKIEDSAILCYEKSGDFCHRHIVSSWLSEFGFDIEEYDKNKNIKTITVESVDYLSEDLCLLNPTKIYVFGDNLNESGTAGQAKIRFCDNSFGIPTKRAPSMNEEAFFSDKDEEWNSIYERLRSLYLLALSGKTIVFPSAGLGTGLAKFKEKSPINFKKMNDLISEHFLSHIKKRQSTLF